jgi:hypothetical protein
VRLGALLALLLLAALAVKLRRDARVWEPARWEPDKLRRLGLVWEHARRRRERRALLFLATLCDGRPAPGQAQAETRAYALMNEADALVRRLGALP